MFTIKKKIVLIALLILALLFILGNYNREVIKSYIDEVVKSPSTRIHLINIAKVAIPLKNLILMRNVDDKIDLLKSSGSCVFCDLSQGNFKGIDLEGVDLRYANLSGADLSYANLSGADLSSESFRLTGRLDTILQDANLTGANLSGIDLRNKDLTGVNLSGVDLSNKDLTGTILTFANLSGANLDGVDLSNKDLTGTILTYANLSGVNLTGTDLSNKDLTGTILTFADLTGANLDGVDLSNKDLTGTILRGVDLSGVDLRNKDLTGANLSGVDLRNKDLTGVNLSGVDLSNKDLTETILVRANLAGANLSGVDLRNKDLTGTNLDGVDLSNKNLTGVNLSGVDLRNKDLTGANLSGVDLSNKDLTGVNLSGVDLSNKDLTETILVRANLRGANLDGVDLRNKDLTGVNLSGVDLSNKDLTGAILKDVIPSVIEKSLKIEISLKQPSNSNWPALIADQNLNVTRYDLSGDVQYLATKEGFLFESKNNESRLVLDLNNDSLFPFSSKHEGGFLGVASQNKLVYVSYISKGINGAVFLVVDEYSMNFSKVRNIIKIDVSLSDDKFDNIFGGNLLFDNLGKLYLSVGDTNDMISAQDLNSLKGKILRLDVSKSKLEPEIVAYGTRSPWGVTIDSKNRMFISQCGNNDVEAVYLLNDLYSGVPANLGWPVFEGSMRRLMDPLKFNDILAPIFETYKRPGCLTAGVYLDDLESFLLGDFYGTIRLLKQKEDGDWYLLYQYKQEEFIWSFGLDEKTKKIFIAPNNLELEILVEKV